MIMKQNSFARQTFFDLVLRVFFSLFPPPPAYFQDNLSKVSKLFRKKQERSHIFEGKYEPQ